jgi:hypothetical protein
MRFGKAQIHSRVPTIPALRFSDDTLTSASGLILFRLLFERLDLEHRIRHACRHTRHHSDFKLAVLFLVLVFHILLGYRKLSDVEYYMDDPIVLRVLGLRRFPNDSTLSHRLRAVDTVAVERQQALNRDLILERLETEQLSRITLDFDGSVLPTRRHAEATAIEFDRKRKSEPSYYPLLCTVAQTGQLFDTIARPGNVLGYCQELCMTAHAAASSITPSMNFTPSMTLPKSS